VKEMVERLSIAHVDTGFAEENVGKKRAKTSLQTYTTASLIDVVRSLTYLTALQVNKATLAS